MDTFIAEVSIDRHRSTLVYLREHGARLYIRWRVFHRHRKVHQWYPDKRRAFVIPVGIADTLARAIVYGASALVSEPSFWVPSATPVH